MDNANAQRSDRVMARSRVCYLMTAACFPIALAGLLSLFVFTSGAVERDDGLRHKSEFAQFSYPVPGELVGERFELRGSVESVATGETVYLAELSEGRYWPKKHLGSLPAKFQRSQVVTAGAGYKYSAVLLSVNETGKTQIEDWFELGRKTGKYPGIVSIEGASPLAKVRVIRR